jgi:hypothetical protein
MPVPPECQTFVDQIIDLEGQIQEIGELPAEDKAKAIAHNIAIRQQITQLQGRLNACRNAFGSRAYSTDVVVYDLSPGGGTVTFPLVATLWGGLGTLETSTVQQGRLSFTHDPPPPSAGTFSISIDETANPTFTGPLFRSNRFPSSPGGSLPDGSPANNTGVISISIPGPALVGADELMVKPSDLPSLTGVTLTSITVTPNQGSITLVVVGLVPGAHNQPVTYTYTFGLTPSRNMSTPQSAIVDVVPSSGVLDPVTAVGRWSAAALFTPLLGSLLLPFFTAQVSTLINGLIVNNAESALKRPLSSTETISIRRIVITPSGIAFDPTFCSYGP